MRNELSNGLHLPGDLHTAENIARGSDALDNFSDAVLPKSGDSWTIVKDVFGGEWSSEI